MSIKLTFLTDWLVFSMIQIVWRNSIEIPPLCLCNTRIFLFNMGWKWPETNNFSIVAWKEDCRRNEGKNPDNSSVVILLLDFYNSHRKKVKRQGFCLIRCYFNKWAIQNYVCSKFIFFDLFLCTACPWSGELLISIKWFLN